MSEKKLYTVCKTLYAKINNKKKRQTIVTYRPKIRVNNVEMPTKDQMKRKTCTEKRRKSSRFLSIFPRIRCQDKRNASICYDAKLGNHNIPHEMIAKNYALISSPFCQSKREKRQSLELKLFFCRLFSSHPVKNVLHG